MERRDSRWAHSGLAGIVAVVIVVVSIFVGLYHGCHIEPHQAPEPTGGASSDSRPYPSGQ